MHQYNKFIKGFCGFAIIYFLIVFFSNLVADPYGIRKNGGRVSNDRLVKAIKVTQIRPRAVFLGSSGTARGLNPEHAALSENDPTYNLSILGANIYELKRYFEHAAANNDLETVVIGLDFYAFNRFRDVRTGFSEARLGARHLIPSDFFGLYLSLDSLNLIFNPDERGFYFAEDGTYEHAIDLEMKRQFEVKLVEDFTQAEQMYWDFEFSQETVNHFQAMAEAAHLDGIDVKVFLPPLHTTLFHSAMVANYWSTYEDWLREVVSIHPVWDFSGCNSITVEPIQEEMAYFEDPSHYPHEVGDFILNRMFDYQDGTVPADFGVYVTPENVDEHLLQVKAQCQQWAEANPDTVRWLGNLNLTRHMKLSQAERLQQ